MKTVFVNRFFFPDESATSQILGDLAFGLAAEGRAVEVVTSRQRYDDARAALGSRETVRGVLIRRVWSTRFGRANLWGRALDYVSFYLSAFFCLSANVSRGDRIVAETDPPLISVVAGWAASLRGARLVNWVQDLFPEVAEAAHLGFAGGLTGKFLRALRDRSLNKAVCNVAISDAMAERLRRNGVPAEKVRVVHNWSDGAVVRPVAPADNPLRGEWGLVDRFVVGYSGNMGRAHEIETVLGAAERLKDDARVRFIFIGGGAQKKYAEDAAAARRLSRVHFKPYQPYERLAYSLSVPDLHLVSLRPELEGLVVPSKFYGVLAAGRPMLYIGREDAELAGILRAERCGEVVPAGDARALADAIGRFSDNLDLARELGLNARKLFEKRFSRPAAMAAWRLILGPV